MAQHELKTWRHVIGWNEQLKTGNISVNSDVILFCTDDDGDFDIQIADQSGRPLQLPSEEKRVRIYNNFLSFFYFLYFCQIWIL